MSRRMRQPPSPAFMQAGRQARREGGGRSAGAEALLRQARKSGILNLSNRSLEVNEMHLTPLV